MDLKIEGVNKLNAKLRRLAGGQAYRRALTDGAAYVKELAATYPATRRRKLSDLGGTRLPGGFLSRRQQRFFFAALKDGTITVPHVRRGQGGLGGGWRITSDGPLSKSVTNATPGGRFVMGARDQSLYHQGNWKTEQEITAEAGPVVLGFMRGAVVQEWYTK